MKDDGYNEEGIIWNDSDDEEKGPVVAGVEM
jgi:hypothetical protein